jgi:putative endonuclease
VALCHRSASWEQQAAREIVTVRRQRARASMIRHERVVPGEKYASTVAAVSTDLRHSLGRAGEALAAEHLERLGYAVLARNLRTRWGELDLVVYDGRALVFVEVKTRRAGSWDPVDAFSPRKRDQVRRMASMWLAEASDRPFGARLRFDAIAVVVDARGKLMRLEHLEDAF